MTSLSFSRVVLIIFNVVFFAFGLALLGIGIYSRVQTSSVDDYLRVSTVVASHAVIHSRLIHMSTIGTVADIE